MKQRLKAGRSFTCGLLTLACVACGSSEPEPEPQVNEGTFEALTYNIAGLPQGISQSDPEVNTALTSMHVRRNNLVLGAVVFSNTDDLGLWEVRRNLDPNYFSLELSSENCLKIDHSS